MTHTISTFDAASLWAKIDEQVGNRTRLCEETMPANKTAVFDALAAAGITRVVVVFDGSGDSGQIEDVQTYAGEESAALPSVDIEIATPIWDGSGVNRRSLPIAKAIDELSYALLEDRHQGWENNEGGFGEFTFDVPERTVQLDYNHRIETSEYHGYSW